MFRSCSRTPRRGTTRACSRRRGTMTSTASTPCTDDGLPEFPSDRERLRMSYKGTILAASLAAGAVLVLTAAGLNNSGNRQNSPADAAVRSEIRVSYVKSYSSFTALRADSSAIVEITAAKQHPEEL